MTKKTIQHFFIVILASMLFINCSDDDASYNANTKQEGETFLIANKTKEGVIVTQSGLQYKILKQGSGKKPTIESKVTVIYKGTFIDGSVFDSSKGNPISFGVKQVIPGWTEGLQLMNVGSKYRFYIPYQLGYGEQGNRGIPGYSVLIFDVELLKIQ